MANGKVGRPKGYALNPRQQLFIKEYLVDLNGKAAAIRAGYEAHTAEKTASRLMAHPNIRPRIVREIEKRAQRIEITSDNVLAELGRIFFFNPQQLYNEDGTMVPVNELDPEVARMIREIDVQADGTVKYKLWDKLQAGAAIAKHLGMFIERFEHRHTITRVERVIVDVANQDGPSVRAAPAAGQIQGSVRRPG